MTVSFSINSQDTSKIIITSEQLRTTNLIFSEHKKFSELIPLLQLENSNLRTINNTWVRTDSIKNMQIYNQNQTISEQCKNMDKLKKSIKVRNSVIGISILTTVLCLILK
jgi:hypothetical protein